MISPEHLQTHSAIYIPLVQETDKLEEVEIRRKPRDSTTDKVQGTDAYPDLDTSASNPDAGANTDKEYLIVSNIIILSAMVNSHNAEVD